MTVATPTSTASPLTTIVQVAGRTRWQLLRSPQVLGIAVASSVLFLLMFRYVVGGAIGVPGVSYVNYLVPGFVVAGLLFTAGGSAVAVAEDADSGVYDRLRSLPISDLGVLAGRALADTALMVLVAIVTWAVGFAIGFRLEVGVGNVVAALGLLVAFSWAFSWIFVWLGLVSGSAQAAQGLGMLAVPFSFVSSAFVPIETMPAVLRVFADWQPLTFMIDAWRGLVLGDAITATFERSLSTLVAGSLLWVLALMLVAMPLALHAYRKG